MKKLSFLTIALMALVTLPAIVASQSVDWKTFDPKKATPEEMDRVNKMLEENLNKQLGKTTGSPAEIKSLIMRGNKITTVVYNYGNITRPSTLGNVADLVWNNLGYGFEFTPLVAGQVTDSGTTYRILDDGMWLANQGGYAPDFTIKWGWLPKAGYSAPGQSDIAAWSHRSDVQGDLTRKPHSWPESWYNPVLGRYVWPAFLGNDATTPDEEVYFVVDDYTNAKYPYYPFAPADTTKRGLGLDMEVRFFQFNNPLAEDIIFLVYRITNKSPRTIDSVWFGMYGDPHIGGPADYADDRAFFVDAFDTSVVQKARNMVYAWDENSRGDGGLIPGYFGFKFLESPSNSTDLIDNDDDGIIDESPFNGAGTYIDGTSVPLTTGIQDTAKYIAVFGPLKPRWSGDEDGDWDAAKDDVGIDGLAGTGDLGEGNGQPDVGNDASGNFSSEPNFGIRDVHESDQIGLTSFNALPYTNSTPNVPKNDTYFFQLLSTDSIAHDQTLFDTPGDNVFVYGSGPFRLAPGETQRFSIALLMGQDLPDLILNAETAQRVLEANYRFAQPPPKPNVTVVPGEDRVTLYWDNASENSIDPLTGFNDFEGYKIYRSEDPAFSDIYTISDANGTPFLGKPLLQNGIPAQFDIKNSWSGLHPVEYLGRGVKYNLGSNTGLVHEYVDSSVVPGKTYYYAVASYDRGFDSLTIQLPPTESQISIIKDPITGLLQFDSNTGMAVPGGLAAGTIAASVDNGIATRTAGQSTGDVRVKIFNDLAVPDNLSYQVAFDSVLSKLVYNVRPLTTYKENFVSLDTVYAPLGRKNLIADSSVVRTLSGTVVNSSNYEIDEEKGRIRSIVPGGLQYGTTYEIEYQYYPVKESENMKGEDVNPVFDGMRVYVKNEPLGIDSARSGWVMKNNTNLVAKTHPVLSFSLQKVLAPINVQIVWNATDRDANGKWLFPGDTLLNNSGQKVVKTPFRLINASTGASIQAAVNGALSDSLWKPGREIAFVTPAPYATPVPPKLMYSVTMSAPTNGDSVIYPAQGNIYEAKTTKPFVSGDRYEFTTQAAAFDAAVAKSELDNIYVVPNPYVVYSNLESPGSSAIRRGDLRLQFRNLPPRCTIRIYTLVGELVDTIEKDNTNSIVDWDLLSYEGQRLAYGVYLYHVDVPGVGEKIGRFALIK